MKIKSITLQNYKRFVEPCSISFCDEEGEANNMNLIVGNNGTGKSSLLHAIIMLIASDSRKKHMSKLKLPGLDLAYIQTGNMPIKIEANIELTNEEIIATQKYAKRLIDMESGNNIFIPTNVPDIKLRLLYNELKVLSNNRGALAGYYYASVLKEYEVEHRKLFDQVGTILWYDEQRTMFSMNDSTNETANIDKLRATLVNAHYFHINITQQGYPLLPGQQDNFLKIQEVFQLVFPNHRFLGAAPRRNDPSKTDFWLTDGKNQYELGGMSAGERALFPILMEFALLNINNSIIIIDELELHLHPPLQQAFVNALPRLGSNNQFILTTHSRSVTALFNEQQTIYLS
jgi:predicted ATPase